MPEKQRRIQKHIKYLSGVFAKIVKWMKAVGHRSAKTFTDFFRKNKEPPKIFYKKAVKDFAKSTGKHLCWGLFLIKMQAS